MNAQWESALWNRQHDRHDHLVPEVVVSRTVSLVTFSALLALVLAGGRPAVAHPGGSGSASSGSSESSFGSSSSASSGGSSSHESASSSNSGS
ncbi:MAG TPA: hypothetical protein VN999_10890, partial [Thermoanaerobaculia bacterium]|nr:hypothetical protein [Thermoanaerobaculia bacterium]